MKEFDPNDNWSVVDMHPRDPVEMISRLSTEIDRLNSESASYAMSFLKLNEELNAIWKAIKELENSTRFHMLRNK
jgi:hypothetical protein